MTDAMSVIESVREAEGVAGQSGKFRADKTDAGCVVGKVEN